MNKNIEKTIGQLHEFSEIINSFKSEAVQERVINYLLHRLEFINRGQINNVEPFSASELPKSASLSLRKRKPGVKKLLDELIETSFFNQERAIGDIVAQLKELGNATVANQISGILQALTKAGKLKRHHSPVSNRYVYLK